MPPRQPRKTDAKKVRRTGVNKDRAALLKLAADAVVDDPERSAQLADQARIVASLPDSQPHKRDRPLFEIGEQS